MHQIEKRNQHWCNGEKLMTKMLGGTILWTILLSTLSQCFTSCCSVMVKVRVCTLIRWSMKSVLCPSARYLTSGLFRRGEPVLSDLKCLHIWVDEPKCCAVQIIPLEGDETTQHTPRHWTSSDNDSCSIHWHCIKSVCLLLLIQNVNKLLVLESLNWLYY